MKCRNSWLEDVIRNNIILTMLKLCKFDQTKKPLRETTSIELWVINGSLFSENDVTLIAFRGQFYLLICWSADVCAPLAEWSSRYKDFYLFHSGCDGDIAVLAANFPNCWQFSKWKLFLPPVFVTSVTRLLPSTKKRTRQRNVLNARMNLLV